MISRLLVRSGALGLALLIPAGVLAQGVAIDHKEIGCIVVGKYPKMNACFAPASLVKKARVYFRPETVSNWYYVEMRSDAPCFSGVLLKPSKALIDKKIFYYVDAQGGGTGRTPEYGPVVVASEEDCKSKLPIAPLSATGPAAVYPSFPAGFVGGTGVSSTVVAGGVAAAAAVTGGAVLLANDDKAAPTVPTTVPVTNPPVTAPPVTVPPPTAPPPSALVVTCRAAPRSGEAPLRVDFATFPSGGTGAYAFEWTFGDGGGSANPNPSHTFLTAGAFNSTVRVTSGSQTAACSRSITVTPTPPTPPPTVPPPGSFTLTVSLTGTGSGQVAGPGITCGLGGTDCSELYVSGTVATLNASPGSSSTFVGWSGDCSGTGPCTVTMTANKAVTARFDATAVLTVTRTGTGTGTVTGTGINCGADCTESYPAGTAVTLTALPSGGSTFTGWSGAVPASCIGSPAPTSCTVTMDVSKTVTAQFGAPPPPAVTLTVTKAGAGTGTVTGTGINCGADCTETYPPGTVVTLTATPTGGSTFAAWSGAVPASCIGSPAPTSCTVTMDVSKTVTAQFDAPPPPAVTLTVTLTGTGTGTVTGTGINCGADCTETYPPGTVVTLTATASGGSFFASWGGAVPPSCLGAPAPTTCTVTMDASKTVTAQFDTIPARTLTVQAGASSDIFGSVTSSPPGITCSWPPGQPCTTSAPFVNGVTVTLTVTTGGMTVVWGGACTGATGNVCNVLMDANKTAIIDTLRLFNADPKASFAPLAWSTQLEVPDGEGQVVMNGRIASGVGPGLAMMTAGGRTGPNRVEGVLVRGSGRPGTWRFDFSGQAAFKPGSLRVVAGTVALVTGDTVVFRLQGKPGERVVFTFEVD